MLSLLCFAAGISILATYGVRAVRDPVSLGRVVAVTVASGLFWAAALILALV